MELTSKAGLCKNLQSSPLYELQIPRIFPRCYDLSDAKETELFAADFKLTASLNVVKKAAITFH